MQNVKITGYKRSSKINTLSQHTPRDEVCTMTSQHCLRSDKRQSNNMVPTKNTGLYTE